MGIFSILKKMYAPTEFDMGDIPFFLAVLRACTAGSRLTFYQSEDESFVDAFREWSHRKRALDFEADHYAVDPQFVAECERLAATGELHIAHHFTIVAPDGRLLCDSLDDFTIVTLADDIKQGIRNRTA
jgi:hypothetical protein